MTENAMQGSAADLAFALKAERTDAAEFNVIAGALIEILTILERIADTLEDNATQAKTDARDIRHTTGRIARIATNRGRP